MIPTLHVGNLIPHGIERGLFRVGRDAEGGINDLNSCFRRAGRWLPTERIAARISAGY
jgi:hypothetical protein